MTPAKWSVTMCYETLQDFLHETNSVHDWRGPGGKRVLVLTPERTRVVMADGRMLVTQTFSKDFFNQRSGDSQAMTGVVYDKPLEQLNIEVDYTRLTRILRTTMPDEQVTLSVSPPDPGMLIEIKKTTPSTLLDSSPSSATTICSLRFNTLHSSQTYEPAHQEYHAEGVIHNYTSLVARIMLFGSSVDITCKGGKIAAFTRGNEASVLSTVEAHKFVEEVPSQRFSVEILQCITPVARPPTGERAVQVENLPVDIKLAAGQPAILAFAHTTCLIAATAVPQESRTLWASSDEALARMSQSQC